MLNQNFFDDIAAPIARQRKTGQPKVMTKMPKANKKISPGRLRDGLGSLFEIAFLNALISGKAEIPAPAPESIPKFSKAWIRALALWDDLGREGLTISQEEAQSIKANILAVANDAAKNIGQQIISASRASLGVSADKYEHILSLAEGLGATAIQGDAKIGNTIIEIKYYDSADIKYFEAAANTIFPQPGGIGFYEYVKTKEDAQGRVYWSLGVSQSEWADIIAGSGKDSAINNWLAYHLPSKVYNGAKGMFRKVLMKGGINHQKKIVTGFKSKISIGGDNKVSLIIDLNALWRRILLMDDEIFGIDPMTRGIDFFFSQEGKQTLATIRENGGIHKKLLNLSGQNMRFPSLQIKGMLKLHGLTSVPDPAPSPQSRVLTN